MSVNVPREELFRVLADGWTYPAWVVGASHVRAVDPDWPAQGSKLHHSVGPWPVHIVDYTEVLAVDRPRLLVLEARFWPLGKARVRFDLTVEEEGRTKIEMTEAATRGPFSMLPSATQRRLLGPRNRESLRRLASLAQGQAERGGGETVPPSE